MINQVRFRKQMAASQKKQKQKLINKRVKGLEGMKVKLENRLCKQKVKIVKNSSEKQEM